MRMPMVALVMAVLMGMSALAPAHARGSGESAAKLTLLLSDLPHGTTQMSSLAEPLAKLAKESRVTVQAYQSHGLQGNYQRMFSVPRGSDQAWVTCQVGLYASVQGAQWGYLTASREFLQVPDNNWPVWRHGSTNAVGDVALVIHGESKVLGKAKEMQMGFLYDAVVFRRGRAVVAMNVLTGLHDLVGRQAPGWAHIVDARIEHGL